MNFIVCQTKGPLTNQRYTRCGHKDWCPDVEYGCTASSKQILTIFIAQEMQLVAYIGSVMFSQDTW